MMANPGEPDDMKPLWEILDLVRQFSDHRDMIAPIGSLIVLRWADQSSPEIIPQSYRWEEWAHLRSETLSGYLKDRMSDSPIIKDTQEASSLPFDLWPLLKVIDQLSSQPAALLEPILSWVSEFDFTTPHGRESARRYFDALLVSYTNRSRAVEFFTPRPVVHLMVELLNPLPGEAIYDPCFGTAGLLVESALRMRKLRGESSSDWEPRLPTPSFSGIEINLSTYTIGLTRLILAGVTSPALRCADTLAVAETSPMSNEWQGFGCAFAVPPWGAQVTQAKASRFQISALNSEGLFLQHIMASLRPGGRAIVALPEGFLYRPGGAQRLRKQILTDFRVDGIVSLPSGAFRPYTGIKTDLLIFRRDEPKSTVRFFEVDQLPNDSRTEQSPEDEQRLLLDSRHLSERFHALDGNPSVWNVAISDLAQRSWELVPKRPGNERVDQLLSEITQSSANVPIRPLHTVANVHGGLRYSRAELVETRDEHKGFIGVVRPSDIVKNEVREPSMHLTSSARSRSYNIHHLRPGDVVLSISGTIGKIGLVAEGTHPLIPSSSLAVLVPLTSILPEYLLALLQSESYQSYLAGRARGAAIRHLALREIKGIPIPIPDTPIQLEVARLTARQRSDALSVLLDLLGTPRQDPVTQWLQTSEEIAALLRIDATQSAAERSTLRRAISESLRAIRNALVHQRSGLTTQNLGPWVIKLADVMEDARDMDAVLSPIARLALLERGRAGVHEAIAELHRLSSSQQQEFEFDLALRVSFRLKEFIEQDIELLLSHVEVEAVVTPTSIEVGKSTEVMVRLRNKSMAPLRDFNLRFLTTGPTVHSAYFETDSELVVPLAIPATNLPESAVSKSLGYVGVWRARRLDGKPVQRDISFWIEVRSSSPESQRDFGSSPYIAGSPIDEPDMFFGRQDILDSIERQLAVGHRANVILLQGNRRSGKTSILKQLQRDELLPGWIKVYSTFQAAVGDDQRAGIPTREVFSLLARDIGRALANRGIVPVLPGQEPPDPSKRFMPQFVRALSSVFSTDRPFDIFESYLASALDAVKPKRLLLMLDEFDKLQDGIETGVTSPQVLENIRSLLHEYPQMSAIITGSRRLQRLREDYWSALFGLGTKIDVSSLDAGAAHLLVTRPVEGRLTFVSEATTRIVDLCSRQPFLIQSLCNQVFDRAARSNQSLVTIATVEEAAKALVSDNEHFGTLWDYAETERKRLILALCVALASEPDPITLTVLDTKLEEAGVELSSRDEIGRDIRFLRDLELLTMRKESGEARYELSVPLMGRWIDLHIDIDDQRRKAQREGQSAKL